MFCSNCGNQLPEGALFCQECGTKVDNEESAAYQTNGHVSDTVIHQNDNMEDVHLDSRSVSETSSADTTDSGNSYTSGQDKFNREKQLERYKEMSQEMLGNLKKTPYQGVLDKLKKIPLVWKAGSVVGILFVIVLCSLIHKPGQDVRESYIEYYSSSVTVEDAFDAFFENGKWSEHREDGDTYVIFTGKCLYLEEKVNVKIRFRIEGDYFYFVNVEMNGKPQSDIISEALFDKVYEAYR